MDRHFEYLAPVMAGALAAALCGPAAGREISVDGPGVEKGTVEIGVSGFVDHDGRADRDRFHTHEVDVGYGATDWMALALIAKHEKSPTHAHRYSATGLEFAFDLADQETAGLGLGLVTEFGLPNEGNDPNQFVWKLLAARQAGPVELTANAVFTKEFGENANDRIGVGYAWQALYAVTDRLGVGFEATGDPADFTDRLRDQEHVLGPVATYEWPLGARGAVGTEIGYLFGLTDGSPDGSFKWGIGYGFVF